MILQLRKRLTLLFTLITGMILTAVVIAAMAVNTAQYEKNNLQNFQNLLLTVSSRLQFGSTVDRSWLASMEAQNRIIIHIEENTVPFLYEGSWKPATDREVLIARAKEQAQKEHVSTTARPVSTPVIRSAIFPLSGDKKDTYYGTVLVFSTTKGFSSMTMIGLLVPASSALFSQHLMYLLLDLLGIGALAMASWLLVGRAVKPVEQSQKRQAEFIAAASHELRSPLSVIRSSASAIPSAPEKEEQLLNHIESECIRMSRLVSDMLLLASTDAKTWPLHKKVVNMDTLLIELYEKYEPVCAASDLTLNLCLPEEPLPLLDCDPERINQLLTVLLDNAVSYTPKGKSIAIRSAVKKQELVIHIEDQGKGIPDEEKKKVFDRFYSGDSSRTDKQHFGLGLSIAYELVKLHGGSITAGDSSLGGADFTVTLPVSVNPAFLTAWS